MKKILHTALVILAVNCGFVQAAEEPRFLIPDFGVGSPLDMINKTLSELSLRVCETIQDEVTISIGSAQSLACHVDGIGSPILVQALANTSTNKVGMRQSVLQVGFLMKVTRTDEIDFRSSMKAQCEKSGGTYTPGKIESCRVADFWRLSWDVTNSGAGWKVESDLY
ncbi:MAG: hypothetical protein WCL27_02300 [Betaproteobacteria bacterium]